MRKFKLLALLLSLWSLGCSHMVVKPNNYSKTDTTNLEQLLALQQPVTSKNRSPRNINSMRLDGLNDIAMSLGAQGALAHRAGVINTMLEERHGELDQVYNFQTLLLAHNVLPPVLAEGNLTVNQTDNDTVRLADRTYRIIEQAKFVTAPPNWREYLLLSYERPELPDYTLLPRADSPEELQVWQRGIQEGWKQGSQQANQIFAANLSRLKRNYNGMILYRRLVNYHMITGPIVAETKLGITGGGQEMTINDRFKRITQTPGLVSDAEQWQPAIAQAFSAVAQPKEQPIRPASIIPKMQPQLKLVDATDLTKAEAR